MVLRDEFGDREHECVLNDARVVKGTGVTAKYGRDLLKRALRYPEDRVTIEYGKEKPTKITLNRHVNCWISPRAE